MKGFLKKTALLILISFVASVIASIAPNLAFLCALVALCVVGFSIFRPLPKLQLGHRGFSAALLVFVILPVLSVSAEHDTKKRENAIVEVKKKDLAQYLQQLEKADQEPRSKELATPDPAQQAAQTKKAEDEKALRLQRQKEKEEAEAEKKRARECGERNEVMAYVMSQEFVKRGLKAPATAEFPSVTKILTRAMGDCRFKINAYVDAQNSFGALLRSPYSATLFYEPEGQEWTLLDMDFQKQ